MSDKVAAMAARGEVWVALIVTVMGCTFADREIRIVPVDGAGALDAPTPDRAEAAIESPDEAHVADASPDDALAVDGAVTDVPARRPMTGACTAAGVESVTPSPSGITVISGTTMTGATNTLPPMCSAAIAENSTKIYRYVMQTSARLLATTNTGLCGRQDTVLAAYFSCDGAPSPVSGMSCNDDDGVNLCGASCGDAGVTSGCGATYSTLALPRLVPGDVLYLVVNSYRETMAGVDTRGPFRLVIAENGLAPARPPIVGALVGVNRCSCPPATPSPMTGDVDFPTSSDVNQLGVASRSIFGTRTLPFARITGVSARVTLSRAAVRTDGPCAVTGGAQAALDLTVGSQIVASGTLDLSTAVPGVVTIPLTTFAGYAFSSTALVPFQYQLRNVEPADTNCITLDIDTTGRNVVTFQGSN